MAVKMKAVSAKTAVRHPGSAGIEPHAFTEKEVETAVRRDWLWPLKVMVKLVLFVALLFALPSPISFLIILFTTAYCLNKLHQRYGKPIASTNRVRRFQGHGSISMGAGSASSLSGSGVYQAGLVGAASAELISDTPDFISDSSSFHWCVDINPASGLPMMENSCIDIGGNVFGDNSMTSIDTGFDCGGISCDPFDSTV